MGTIPATGYESSVVQTFSSPTGTSHTMTYTASVNDMILVINNVIQEPTVAYTTSGTTLTTGTLISGDTMYIIYLALTRQTSAPGADTVTNAMIVDNAINSEHYTDGSIDLAHMSVNSIDSDQYVDASIDNAHLADDAVGVDELSATGTASSSTFLRGDNAWAAAGGGSWNLIGTSDASGSATLDQTGLNDTYEMYAILCSDMVPATDSVNMYMRLGDSSGFDSGGSDYSWHNNESRHSSASYTAAISSGASFIRLSDSTGTGTGERAGFVIWLLSGATNTGYPTICWTGGGLTQTGVGWIATGSALRLLDGMVVDRVQVFFDTGNIATGRMSVYGIKHT